MKNVTISHAYYIASQRISECVADASVHMQVGIHTCCKSTCTHQLAEPAEVIALVKYMDWLPTTPIQILHTL